MTRYGLEATNYLRLWPLPYVFYLGPRMRMPWLSPAGVQWSDTYGITERWDVERVYHRWEPRLGLRGRLLRIVKFHRLCRHRGCRKRAIECSLPLMPDVEYLCADHAGEAGYCVNCGIFKADCFESPTRDLCLDCHTELVAEAGEHFGEHPDWYDDPPEDYDPEAEWQDDPTTYGDSDENFWEEDSDVDD